MGGVILIYLLGLGLARGAMGSLSEKLRAWFVLSRPPFHIVGVLPFVLGAVLAWWLNDTFRWDILVWGTLGVVFILLSTYYAGEYWDYAEDLLSGNIHASPFAGGSQVVQRGLLSREAPLRGAVISITLALCVGVVLQFGYHTGSLTLPLGIIGIVGGFFYSARPIRWVRRGYGEVWIAFCYGWLTVATGYYLQAGNFAALVTWVAIPIALTIFNVILLNEFFDYQADMAAGKTNLAVRVGRQTAAHIYVVVGAASWIAWLSTLREGVPVSALWVFVPTVSVSLVAAVLVLRGWWHRQVALGRLCAATLVVNIGTTASYLFAFLR